MRVSYKKTKSSMTLDANAIKVIADMQRDLDAYHFALGNIIGYLKGFFGELYRPAILKGIEATKEVADDVEMIFKAAIELREEYEKLKEKYCGEEK